MNARVEPAYLFVNSSARLGREGLKEAERALRERSVTLACAIATRGSEDLQKRVREALQQGAKTVIVGGGDGTLRAAVDVLAHTGARLGVIPLGTGNDFARGLGLPRDIRGACEVVATGAPQAIDLGAIRGGERHFLNALSVGFSIAVTQELDGALKRVAGPMAYALASLRALRRVRRFEVTLRFSDRELRREALQVIVGNGRYQGGGRLIAPEAGLTDHRLDTVTLVAPADKGPWRDRVRLLRFAASRGAARHTRAAYVEHVRSTAVEISTQPAQALSLDGELIGATPVTIDLHAGALQVLLPRANR